MVNLNSRKERLIFVAMGAIGFLLAMLLQLLPVVFSEFSIGVAALALIFAVIAFALKDYSYLIEPLTRMKGRSLILEMNEPFYLSQNGKCIVIRAEGLVYATSFIKIPIYKSSTEMTDEEKFNFSSVFSRAISISNQPMRMSSQLHMVNKDEYLKVVTNRLNEVEDRYNALLADKDAQRTAVDRVKGEVNMWHNLLDSITKSNSQAQTAFTTITMFGGNEDEAVNISSMTAEQIAAGLSAAIGVPATVATGDDILLFVEPDYQIPPTTVSEFMKAGKPQAQG